MVFPADDAVVVEGFLAVDFGEEEGLILSAGGEAKASAQSALWRTHRY